MKIQRNIKDFFNSTFTIECSGLELIMLCSDLGDHNGFLSKERIEGDYRVSLPDAGTCNRVHSDMHDAFVDMLGEYEIEELGCNND